MGCAAAERWGCHRVSLPSPISLARLRHPVMSCNAKGLSCSQKAPDWVSVPSPNGERVRVRGDVSRIHPHPNLLPAREKGLRANVTLSNYALKSCRYRTDTSERVRKSRSLVTKRVAPASRQVATRRASAGLSRWRAAFSRLSPVSAGGFQSPDLFAAESCHTGCQFPRPTGRGLG